MVIIDGLDTHNITCFLCDLVALNALTAAILHTEIFQGAALSHALFRYNKDGITL